MIYTFDMEHGAEEMNHDIFHMMHGSLVCFEFKCHEPTVASHGFILPNHYDDLIPFLFDISRTKTIIYALRHMQRGKGCNYLTAYSFNLVDSNDGQTNITPEFVSAISRWKEVLS